MQRKRKWAAALYLRRSGTREPLSHGHELDELPLRQPLRLVDETLVKQGDVGGGAAVGDEAEGQELPKYLGFWNQRDDEKKKDIRGDGTGGKRDNSFSYPIRKTDEEAH